MVMGVATTLTEREIKKLRDEIERQIRVIQKTGKLRYGIRNVIRALQRGEAKVIVMATNIPSDMKTLIKYYCALTQTPLVEFPGTSAELGVVCGRPHLVSSVVVLDVGASSIMDYAKVISA